MMMIGICLTDIINVYVAECLYGNHVMFVPVQCVNVVVNTVLIIIYCVFVDVLSSAESSSSSEDEGELYSSATSRATKDYSLTGLSISSQYQGDAYTFQSAQWPSAKKFVDIKIYDHPKQIKNLAPHGS